MVEIKIHVTESQLARMDRMLRNQNVRGGQWLKDAVAIYKNILESRKGRFSRPSGAKRRRVTHEREARLAG